MYEYLSGRLKQLGVKQGDLAKRWNLSQAAISHRFCGKTPWTIDEMYDILEICYAQPEELHIFFPLKGIIFNKKDLPAVHNLPLFLTVKIEQPTTDKLEISCSVQQHCSQK